MSNIRQLGDGIELVKDSTFWTEGCWSIRKGEQVWSKIDGWLKYYKIDRPNCIFRTAEEAMQSWNASSTRKLSPTR